jgi:SAM-dependent methyltransferase
MSVALPPAGGTPWSEVFADALRGEPCTVHGVNGSGLPLPVDSWRGRTRPSDHALLAHCADGTLDIGCGPGRLTHGLLRAGKRSLGIDVVTEAVRQARSRGATAVVRDVFDPVPGEGRWSCALLADGNVGIGGDPVRLLRRVHEVLEAAGRLVVELAPPGAGVRTRRLRLECAGRRSHAFAWSWVGADRIGELAPRAGFAVRAVHEHRGRWVGVLDRRSAP